jgi:hypothetical protein
MTTLPEPPPLQTGLKSNPLDGQPYAIRLLGLFYLTIGGLFGLVYGVGSLWTFLMRNFPWFVEAMGDDPYPEGPYSGYWIGLLALCGFVRSLGLVTTGVAFRRKWLWARRIGFAYFGVGILTALVQNVVMEIITADELTRGGPMDYHLFMVCMVIPLIVLVTLLLPPVAKYSAALRADA